MSLKISDSDKDLLLLKAENRLYRETLKAARLALVSLHPPGKPPKIVIDIDDALSGRRLKTD